MTPIKKAAMVLGWAWDSSDAVFAADHFNLLIADFEGQETAFPFGTYMAEVKAHDATVKIFGYKNLSGMYTIYEDWAECNAQESWFLHDSLGNRIQNTTWGWYLMDPSSTGWQQHLVDYINSKFASFFGYDGVFFDDVRDELDDLAAFDHPPQAADIATWHADVEALLAHVKADITAGKQILINTNSGWEWGHTNYDYLTIVDGMMIEGYYHAPWEDSSTYTKVAESLLNCLIAAVSMNKIIVCLGGNMTNDSRILTFCYTAFLMGADTTYAYFAYNDEGSGAYYDLEASYKAIMDTNIGGFGGAHTIVPGTLVKTRMWANYTPYFNPNNTTYTIPNVATLIPYSGFLDPAPVPPPPALEMGRSSIAVVFGGVTPPQNEVISLLVHLGCSKEVSSYELTLQNWDAKYSPGGTYPITVGTDGSISLGRGIPCPLLMTCHVERVKCTSTPKEHYITISGRCWGERLFRKTITKTYNSQKGEAIIKDLIDYYVGLSHIRSGTELIEDTDTTYLKLEYTDSPVWDILKYIAETADKSGVIGYDFRVAPDAKFEFFPKGTKSSAISLTEAVDGEASYEKDIVRVRNKITIYGLADKSLPTDKVRWTRSLTPTEGDWIATSGTASLDATGAPDGGECVKLSVTSLYFGVVLLMLDAGNEVDTEVYPSLVFQMKMQNAYTGTGTLTLTDNTAKTAVKKISISPDAQWHNSEIGVGSLYANQWDTVTSGFDWTHVQAVTFYMWFPQSVGSGSFWVHGLYFGGLRYSSVQQDAASQAAYGIREYVETDEELITDTECEFRAKALLAFLKDPAEYINLTTTLFDYGLTPVQAGDMQNVVLPNEGVSGNYRVEYVEYRVPQEYPGILETTFQLGREPPQLADYIYGLRPFTVNVEKLSRTKLGRRGMPISTVGGGGGTSASSIFNSDVEIDKVSPVLNFLTSRGLKATVAFDGTNFFVVSYVGDLILRAQSQIIRPYADGSDDLGSPSFRFDEVYVKTGIKVAGVDTIDANGRLNINAMPRDSAGLIIEAQGAGFYPMYVNPNGRYSPAAHAHAAGDVTSGELAIARMPRDAAGLILEAEGAGFYPMYVDPNGRYTPASHNHSMDDITSGGETANVDVAKAGGGTRTLQFTNGKYTGYSDS